MGDWGPSGEVPSLTVQWEGSGLLLMVQPLPQQVFYGKRLKKHVSQPFRSPHIGPHPCRVPGRATELSWALVRPRRAQGLRPPGHINPRGAI